MQTLDLCDTTPECIAPSHLAQLCEPDRIEHTLRLLCYLNHWAKAREHLFYADRHSFLEVKEIVLRYAYKAGFLKATTYIDGFASFEKNLGPLLDQAAEKAAEGIIMHLSSLDDPDIAAGDPDYAIINVHGTYNHLACRFYSRMTGKVVTCASDVEIPDRQQLWTYIRTQLEDIANHATYMREPLPPYELALLCIAPIDILPVADHRYYYLEGWMDSWDDLGDDDLKKLDPEGTSRIEFQYVSPTARYVFHLPFRDAQMFMSPEALWRLKKVPTPTQESGEYYGHAITRDESLDYPVEIILRELGVDVKATCPLGLSDKQQYTLAQVMTKYTGWEDDWSYNDEDEELDEGNTEVALIWRSEQGL